MRQSSWQDNLSWFPENHPKALADLFPIILHMIHEQTWYEPLKLAISWYVQANNAPTMESGIIMAQVGMELLAWVEMVEKKAIISKEGFDKLTTTDKLRLFFSWARIPVSLPSELVALKALADGSSQKNQRWEDGPEALVEFRNSVTHARRRDRVSNASTEALWDTHKLALWYLELSILHVLGYQGLYTCRIRTNLFRGQHEFVPWRMDNTKDKLNL